MSGCLVKRLKPTVTVCVAGEVAVRMCSVAEPASLMTNLRDSVYTCLHITAIACERAAILCFTVCLNIRAFFLNTDIRMLAATTNCISPLNTRYMFRQY